MKTAALIGWIGLIGVVVGLGAKPDAEVKAPTEPTQRATLPMHSHNDYYRQTPLREALQARARSVEVDVFPLEARLVVAHTWLEIRPERTIETLYLEPLRVLLKKQGRVYADQTVAEPLILLVDFKRDGPRSLALLEAALQPLRTWLVRVEDGKRIDGYVCVVISGNTPRELITQQPDRLFFIDGRRGDLEPNGLSAQDAPLVSDRWSNVFQWRGAGPFPRTERDRLQTLVAQAHARGQLIRFWAAPDHERSWAIQLEAGVDLINTDQPKEFATWYARRVPPGRKPETQPDER